MGERALGGGVRRESILAGRSVPAWCALLALSVVAVVLALGFLPPPPPGPARAAGDPFATGESLAGFTSLVPGRSSALAAVLGLGFAALFAAQRLERTLGPEAPLWVAVWLGASAAAAAIFWTPAAAILAAAAMAAWALLLGGETPVPERLPEVWQAEPGRTAAVLRFGLAGALLGLLGAAHPAHLLQLAPALLAAGGTRRRWRRLALAAGAALVVAVRVARGGVGSWLEPLTAPVLEPQLWAWNLLYLFAGRNVGLLVLFPAVVLLAFAAGKQRERRLLLLAVAAELLVILVFQPFDFAGTPAAIGNRVFLPLYGALLFGLGRPVGRAPALVVGALAAALLWPLVSAPRAHPFDESGRYRWARGPVAERLPFETTVRGLPGSAEVQVSGVRMRSLNDAIWPAGTGGSLRLLGGAQGEVLLASRAPLGSLLIEFAREAKGDLEVGGGELGETILRPDGGIAFVVLLDGPRARHPTGWSRAPQNFYFLRLRLPEAPPRPLALAIAPQRKPGG